MQIIDILLREYDNLWQEKLLHKQSLRKFHTYISFLISIGSLALTFKGVSTTDIMKTALEHLGKTNIIENMKILENAADAILLLCIPLTPIILLIASYAINDLFQIYVIGSQIGNIERKINIILDKQTLLWEHRICAAVYGRSEKIYKEFKIAPVSNLIRLSDKIIFIPFIIIVCLIASYVGAQYVFIKFGKLYYSLYLFLTFYLIGANLWLLWELNNYTKDESLLSKSLCSLNMIANKRKIPSKNHLE